MYGWVGCSGGFTSALEIYKMWVLQRLSVPSTLCFNYRYVSITAQVGRTVTLILLEKTQCHAHYVLYCLFVCLFNFITSHPRMFTIL